MEARFDSLPFYQNNDGNMFCQEDIIMSFYGEVT